MKLLKEKKKEKKHPIKSLAAFYKEADYHVYASTCVMGLGQLLYGQITKGLLYLAILGAFVWYFITKGFHDLIGFFTLGTNTADAWMGIEGDNSMTMLILGVFAWILLVIFVCVWVSNIKDSMFTLREVRKGKKPRNFQRSIQGMLDEKFYMTSLAVPVFGVCVFSILPIVFMTLIAFTNMGGDIEYPVLADWSLSSWGKLFSMGKIGSTFTKILGWNVLWAITTTLINYFGGLGLALLLNKKIVKGSKFWRAFPMLAYAVPGFITMIGFKYMFSQVGPINQMITAAGGFAIPFFTNTAAAKWWARGIGLLVNAWISIPSSMLLATSILSNQSTEQLEAAAIDGASKFQQFRKITLPFVVFSTTTVLISSFIGNFNNFGIFFFMRGGMISEYADYFLASDTDLLINWLYNLSVSNNYYSIGAAISLVIFAFTSIISLAIYINSSAYKQEDTYR